MIKQNEQVQAVIVFLKELMQDNTMPRNVRDKISNIAHILSSNEDVNISKDRAISELDDISNDVNLKSYTRTQIWSVVSMLEKL